MPLARKASIVKLRDTVREKVGKYTRRLSVGAAKIAEQNEVTEDAALEFSFESDNALIRPTAPFQSSNSHSPKYIRSSPTSPRIKSLCSSSGLNSNDYRNR